MDFQAIAWIAIKRDESLRLDNAPMKDGPQRAIEFRQCPLPPAGKNYGWSRFEGSRCQEAVQNNDYNPACKNIDRSGFEFPIFEVCIAARAPTDSGHEECGETVFAVRDIAIIVRGNKMPLHQQGRFLR